MEPDELASSARLAAFLRDALAGSGAPVSASCASPGGGGTFVVTAEKTRVFGAPFASIPRAVAISQVRGGQPLRVGAEAYWILESFRDRFADLLGTCDGDPQAWVEALALSIEGRSGIEFFYGQDVEEIVAQALRCLPPAVVILPGGRTRDGRELGRKVGGAAKDLAALRLHGLTPEKLLELEASGNEQALAAIDKDAVIPDHSLDDLREKEFPPALAYLFVVLRRALPRRPPPHPRGRGIFVSCLTRIFGDVMATRRVEEARRALLVIFFSLGAEDRRVLGPRFCRLLPAGPGMNFDAWNRAWAIEAEPDAGKAWDLARSGLYPKSGGAEGEGGGEETPFPARRKRALDDIRREGPPVVAGGPEVLVDRFGLTGIEFGNWVAREEGRRHMTLLAGALQDLEEVLGLELRRLARTGNLAIALGSRGKGRTCAHYEPGKRVINLTRTACDGSVAHEFAHFLDHMAALRLGDEMFERYFVRHRGFLSEEKSPGPNPSPSFQAMGRLMATIRRGEVEEVVASEACDRWYLRDWILGWLDEVGGDPQAALDRILFMFGGKFTMGRDAREKCVCLVDSMARWVGRPLTLRIRYFTSTDFDAQAGRLGRYWRRPRELFARAFESFVEDELLARSRRNEYLVDGTRDDYGGCRGWPYPRGEERRRIDEALREFLATLKDDHPGGGAGGLASQFP